MKGTFRRGKSEEFQRKRKRGEFGFSKLQGGQSKERQEFRFSK